MVIDLIINFFLKCIIIRKKDNEVSIFFIYILTFRCILGITRHVDLDDQ